MKTQNGGRRRSGGKEKLKILEEARQAGATVSEVCRRHGISSAQYYTWEKQVREAALERLGNTKRRGKDCRGREVERLEAENQRLKAVIAEITSENLELKENVGL